MSLTPFSLRDPSTLPRRSKHRRAVLSDDEYDARMKEVRRKETLSMWDSIEEADASDDVKEILHQIAAHVGLEG